MAGSSFSIGGIVVKTVCKRLVCAGVSFFAGVAVGFLEEELDVDLFFDKNNHYIVYEVSIIYIYCSIDRGLNCGCIFQFFCFKLFLRVL